MMLLRGCVGLYRYGVGVLGAAVLGVVRPVRQYGAADETRKTKFAKRTWNVSWNQQINFLVRFTDPVAEARTHRKKRDVCATRGWFWLRERTQPVGKEPGRIPEINRLPKSAQIAVWVLRGDILGS